MSVGSLLLSLAVWVIPVAIMAVILYFLVKAAVRNGVREALQERDRQDLH